MLEREAEATQKGSFPLMQEQLDGKNVGWMEQVSDDQYLAQRSAT